MISEISTPDLNDLSERKKVMQALEQREQLEMDLQSCLESLTGKPMELEKKPIQQVNIYKPTLVKPVTTKPDQKQDLLKPTPFA
jgi:hypothetical protein